MHIVVLFKPSEHLFSLQLALGEKCIYQTNKTISSERKKNIQQYHALLYNDDTRVFVSFLLLFLLTIDAIKLGLRGAQTATCQQHTVYVYMHYL